MQHPIQSLRRNFLAGLFVVLPIILSLWLLVFFFDFVTKITAKILVLLPREAKQVFLTPADEPTLAGRLLTLVFAVLLMVLVGSITRHVVGRGAVGKLEDLLLRVPLLNKIYPAVKEIVAAFQPERKTAFREAVLVEYPTPGTYAVAFVTGEIPAGAFTELPDALVTVFVPTTPNPTSGFMLMLPRKKVFTLNVSVADAIKLVISGGTVHPPRFSATASPAVEAKLTAIPTLPTH